MNRTNPVLGILMIVIGGILATTSMVYAIISFSGSLYEDIYAFDVTFDHPATTEQIKLNAKKISIWLKVRDRQIENKDFEFVTSLVPSDDTFEAVFSENFRIGYSRNSAGDGQYYRLGDHKFQKAFNGYLRFESRGTWTPPYSGHLVVREGRDFLIPLKQIGVIVLGAFVIVVGIGTISKHRKQTGR